jgi:cellulose synthase/poly-beta-1,6-N-acetylglucosamine synthase-like glycosyltransferase
MQISVIIPAYNAESTLEEAVKSALNQGPNIEDVIIIVNGCTDNTTTVANSLSKEDSRVRVVTSEKGKVPARNKGFEVATSPLIALLDADDIWHPEKINKQLAEFDEYTDIVATQILTARKDGTPYPEQIWHPSSHAEIVSTLLSGRNCIANSSVLFRKSLLNHIGTYEDCFPFCEDYHLWLRAIKFAKMKIIPERLVTYRFEPNPGYDPQIAIALSTFYRSLYTYTGIKID